MAFLRTYHVQCLVSGDKTPTLGISPPRPTHLYCQDSPRMRVNSELRKVILEQDWRGEGGRRREKGKEKIALWVSVLDRSGCHKMPDTEWLINNGNLFLTN